MPDPKCPICRGTGFELVERAGLTGAKPCQCSFVTRARDAKENANIPPNYTNVSLDSSSFLIPENNPIAMRDLAQVQLKVKGFVREFPAGNKPGLLLIGEPGSGKTHLAVAALKALLERGHEGVFFDYKNLLDKIRAGYDSNSGASDREAYRSALDAEILLLDDLGAHRVTEWVEDTVTSIITYRCNHRKPLIATTNLPDPDAKSQMVDYTSPGGVAVHRKTLAELIGTRARSRLWEMCEVVCMPIVEDYRVKRGR